MRPIKLLWDYFVSPDDPPALRVFGGCLFAVTWAFMAALLLILSLVAIALFRAAPVVMVSITLILAAAGYAGYKSGAS